MISGVKIVGIFIDRKLLVIYGDIELLYIISRIISIGSDAATV